MPSSLGSIDCLYFKGAFFLPHRSTFSAHGIVIGAWWVMRRLHVRGGTSPEPHVTISTITVHSLTTAVEPMLLIFHTYIPQELRLLLEFSPGDFLIYTVPRSLGPPIKTDVCVCLTVCCLDLRVSENINLSPIQKKKNSTSSRQAVHQHPPYQQPALLFCCMPV